jgi:tetratricopeptide (TPR) repeat protein
MPTVTDAIAQAFQSFTAREFDRAEWWCHQVLQVDPNRSEMLNLLGTVCYQTGRLSLAIGWYREAIDANPNYAEAYNNLGVALQDLGQLEVAIAQFEAAIELAPDYVQAYFNLGNALMADGQIEIAIAAYERTLRLDPNFTAARNNLAYLYQSIDNYQQAIALYRQTISMEPESALAHMNLANLLQEQGNLEGAMVHYTKASQLEPMNADLAYNLALAHQRMGNVDQAIALCYESLKLDSRHGASHHQLGTLLQSARPMEALAHLQQAITYQPDFAEAYQTLGLVWQDRMELEGAIASFRQAIALDPDFADAYVSLGQALLMIGDYAQGFELYEWRWRSAAFLQTQLPRHRSMPTWDGSDLQDKTILVWSEQGIRETLLFLRFVTQVGGEIYLECDRGLVDLFQNLPGVKQNIPRGEEVPKCDFQLPLMSLPRIYKTTLETVPKELNLSIPIKSSSNVQRIGIAVDQDLQELTQSFLAKFELTTLSGDNYCELATTIAQLDLVIATDNAIAHLAATLGVKTWIMLEFSPHWIWLCDRTSSPWYANVTLFHQPEPQDWTSVIHAITTEIQHSPASETHPPERQL